MTEHTGPASAGDADDDLRGLAMAAFDEHERSVSDAETDSALAAVRERVATGDGASSVGFGAHVDARRPTWALLGSAAAVVAVVVGGLVLLAGGSDGGDDPVAGDLPAPTGVDAAGASTTTTATDPGVDDEAVREPTTTASAAAASAVSVSASASVSVSTAAIDDVGEPAPTTTTIPAHSADGMESAGGGATTTVTAVTSEATPAPTTTVVATSSSVATTSVAPAVAPVAPGVLAIPDGCDAGGECTQLANDEDGHIVAYDPAAETLSVWDATGAERIRKVALVDPLAGRMPVLEHVGPDHVAYLSAIPLDAGDPVRELRAIPLDGDRSGTVVMSWSGLDGSGDSSLVAQRAGLVPALCCAVYDGARPAADAPIYRFVDRDGEIVQSDAPRFRLDLGDAGNNVVRIDGSADDDAASSTFWSLPSVWQSPRDVPQLVATDDGGALGLDASQETGQMVIVDFDTDWPDVGIDNGDVYLLGAPGDADEVALLERGGTVVVRGPDGFVRRTLDEVGTPGWPGGIRIGTTSGSVDAFGLNDYIERNQPAWAEDLRLFAYQLQQSVGPNQRVTVDVAAADDEIEITTRDGFDDSVADARIVATVERAPDGLFRFVDGSFAFTCQPGRGHQDFSTELCT